uniref:Uncharacterized protein n=1 Tax=Wuchereria bancrofti TaxID=6293 RepID=A0AAF5Q1M3_WUCBA
MQIRFLKYIFRLLANFFSSILIKFTIPRKQLGTREAAWRSGSVLGP